MARSCGRKEEIGGVVLWGETISSASSGAAHRIPFNLCGRLRPRSGVNNKRILEFFKCNGLLLEIFSAPKSSDQNPSKNHSLPTLPRSLRSTLPVVSSGLPVATVHSMLSKEKPPHNLMEQINLPAPWCRPTIRSSGLWCSSGQRSTGSSRRTGSSCGRQLGLAKRVKSERSLPSSGHKRLAVHSSKRNGKSMSSIGRSAQQSWPTT